MERFGSIKKNANQIQNLCRLCGMNNPGMTLICEDLEMDVIDLDDDPSLQEKIEACIGILVSPNDKLPQYSCGICTDKICDFFEFRLMCTSTDIQTRRLLGLPLRDERKPVVKHEMEPLVTIPGHRSGPGPKSRFVQPMSIKVEEPVLMEIAPPPDVVEENRRQSKKKKNQYEPVVQLKKIKVETDEIQCSVCGEKFTSDDDKYAHMYNIHIPNFSKFGCSSCGMACDTLEWQKHRSWHQRLKKPFICHRCGESIHKYALYAKHIQNNKCSEPWTVIQPDIQCELCRKKFSTRNLYEWHACFIKNKTNCRKCGQYFANKTKLFQHFLKCPLPFIEIAPAKYVEPKTKSKTTSKNSIDKALLSAGSEIKTENDLDISALLETNLSEGTVSGSGLDELSSQLSSLDDAINKISTDKSKKKSGKKSKKKVTPLKIIIKKDPDAEPNDNVNDDELEHNPTEDHFADVDSEDDDSNSQTTNTETSGSVTPAFSIKQENLDTGYGDNLKKSNDKNPNQEKTIQDIIRNIKKEPGVHTQAELAAAVRAQSDPKIMKTINPLALNINKPLSQQQLILRIKKERSEKAGDTEKSTKDSEKSTDDNENEEVSDSGPVKKAINPLAAAHANKIKKKKLLKIPAQLALKIKKEKSKALKKMNEALTTPSIRIKQEKPDSDDEHHEEPIETDYLGLNPLSLLKQKQKDKESAPNDQNNSEKDQTVSTDKSSDALKTSTVKNPISSLFGAKTGGFMKLSMTSSGFDFGAPKNSTPSDSTAPEIQVPVIANIVSGTDASFSDPETTEGEPKNKDKTSEEEKETPQNTEKSSEISKPKLGGFMKLSGITGGFQSLQFPATSSKSNETSQNSSSNVIEPPKQVPSIIPGFGSGTGFKKLSLSSTVSTTHDEPSTLPSFPKSSETHENVKVQIPPQEISSLDLDDLISSPTHSTDIDMESLLKEKLLDDENVSSNNDNNGTDDFLKEIDEQLGDET